MSFLCCWLFTNPRPIILYHCVAPPPPPPPQVRALALGLKMGSDDNPNEWHAAAVFQRPFELNVTSRC